MKNNTKEKSQLGKAYRTIIRTFLKNGVRAEDLEFFMVFMVNGMLYKSFSQLPTDIQVEIRMMEAEIYLKKFPDATREERRETRAWARSNHSVYSNGSFLADENGRLLDVITEMRFPVPYDFELPF